MEATLDECYDLAFNIEPDNPVGWRETFELILTQAGYTVVRTEELMRLRELEYLYNEGPTRGPA